MSKQTSEDTALNSKQQTKQRQIIELRFDLLCDGDISDCDKSDSNVCVN